jgi:hypothetical protein
MSKPTARQLARAAEAGLHGNKLAMEFADACILANTPPTKRQAAKYMRGEGIAYKTQRKAAQVREISSLHNGRI